MPILAEAFDHVLHTATLYDVPLTARYLKSDLLSYDRLHLAEHHLYGSSRLGIQRYLPSEYSYTASSTEGSTYDRLPESRSWYSRYANDLFSSGLSSNTLTSYNLSLSDLPLFNHILGNRQFELTNHLGNVQSTVLDRTHPRIGFAGNGSVITGYQANIASAQDYFPFGMYMPGRYISDTVQHCITVTKRIRVPRFMPWRFFPVTSYPPVFGTLSTHVFRYGDPVVPGVHELSKATLMADEKPYVYHLLPASQHIGGAVLKAAAGPDSTAEYTIDLGGEPAPVYSYLHLHPDTALAIQSLNVTVHHSPGVLVEARIRQYNAAGVEDFSVPLDWQPLPEGQPYALDFATDVTAIVAGGATMLEYRTSPVGGGTFAAASEVTYTATIVTVSLSELRDVLVTICDEKDNYRFGFNGHEKLNEVVGIGNHYDFSGYGLDVRLGRRWQPDPEIASMPSLSSYSAFRDNPIFFIDPTGRIPYPITIRAFAPFKVFGFGFHGDDRGYSTADATARVHQKINFDTDKPQLTTMAWSSPTWKASDPKNQRTATPFVKFQGAFTTVKKGDNKSFSFGSHVAAGNPLTPKALTPNIDVFSNFSITENKKEGTLRISGSLKGDNFPSTEAFMTDPKGNNLFIGVGQIAAGVGRDTGPFTELRGENKDRNITDFDFTITTDKDGNFTGVKEGNRTYSTQEWNTRFIEKPTQKQE